MTKWASVCAARHTHMTRARYVAYHARYHISAVSQTTARIRCACMFSFFSFAFRQFARTHAKRGFRCVTFSSNSLKHTTKKCRAPPARYPFPLPRLLPLPRATQHTCVRRIRDARAHRLLRRLTRTNRASETPQQTAVLGRAVGLRRGPLLPAGLHATHPVFAPWAAL